MSRRAEYLSILALLAASGVLGVVASSRVWGSAVPEASLTATARDVTGDDLVPFASAVSLVALAAVLAVPAVRNVGRRIVGGVLVVLGGGVAVAASLIALSLTQRVRSFVETDPSGGGPVGTVETTPLWAFALVVAGLLILVAGASVAVRGPSWAKLSHRYERPAQRRAARSDWDALDEGDDPTLT